MPKCSVIIVTHNSHIYLAKAIHSLKNQTVSPTQIILVDSGSDDPSYLPQQEDIDTLLLEENVGFCRANNIGMQPIHPDSSYVLFMNPDAFLTPTFLEEAIHYMEDPNNQQVGICSGILLGYDVHNDQPTGYYDSTGIYCSWYGRWFDRDQGEKCQGNRYHQPEEPDALCGALLFCRKKALDDTLINDDQVFDETFYMYKEDIDLSLRMKKKGWKLSWLPKLIAYHCRGWQRNRKKIPRKFRLLSAKNELRIHFRNHSPKTLYSLLKYLVVLVLDV